MDKNKYCGIGVGSTSIVMIFVVLCLTTFSVMSLTSSHVGKKYAEKMKVHAIMNYEAQIKANQILQQIDTILLKASNDATNYDNTIMTIKNISGVTLISNPDGYSVSYNTSITKTSNLAVGLKIPSAPSDERYSISKWAETPVQNTYQEQPNNIWDGN